MFVATSCSASFATCWSASCVTCWSTSCATCWSASCSTCWSASCSASCAMCGVVYGLVVLRAGLPDHNSTPGFKTSQSSEMCMHTWHNFQSDTCSGWVDASFRLDACRVGWLVEFWLSRLNRWVVWWMACQVGWLVEFWVKSVVAGSVFGG